jgi:hypothetical protein
MPRYAALNEVVVGLERDRPVEAFGLGDAHPLLDAGGRVVGDADVAHLARVDQPGQRREGLLQRNGLVVEVGVVQIDVVGSQALERRIRSATDVVGGQAAELRVLAHLRGEHHIVAIAARFEPLADDPLRVATAVARHPRRIAVGGVDEVAAGGRVIVEDGEGCVAVGRPAEHVAAE